MKYYLIGIKGAGMSALGLILDDLGYNVVGYDDTKEHQFTEDKLIERGIKIYTEDNDEIDENTIVIRSSAVKDEHPQMVKANNLNLKTYEYYQMLGKLANMFELITVAGCHGKTTTTSMMAHVLGSIVGCNYLIGDGTGKVSKEYKRFVIEACEYQRHFLVYEPKYAIITNIDLDHVDYFKDMNDIMDAYTEYANNASKMVIACGEDTYARLLELNKPIFYYGLDDNNDIVAQNVEYTSEGVSFDVEIEGNPYGHFELPIYGKHMLLDALAVIAVCYYERIEAKDVVKVFKTFGGANRRFAQTVIGNNVIIDDYAHHPNEVKATIKAVKQKYPDKKIVAVFQPHTFSRTKEFASELARVLNRVDYAYVLDVYSAREKQEDHPDITSDLIINELEHGERITDDTWDKLKKHEDSVVIFMSPKEISVIMNNYRDYLENVNKVS